MNIEVFTCNMDTARARIYQRWQEWCARHRPDLPRTLISAAKLARWLHLAHYGGWVWRAHVNQPVVFSAN